MEMRPNVPKNRLRYTQHKTHQENFPQKTMIMKAGSKRSVPSYEQMNAPRKKITRLLSKSFGPLALSDEELDCFVELSEANYGSGHSVKIIKCTNNEKLASCSSDTGTRVQYKGSKRVGDYRNIPEKMSKTLRFYLSKGEKACFVTTENSGRHYLFDFETMQQHNIDTGFRRSIRLSDSDPYVCDFDSSGDSADSCNESHLDTTPKSPVLEQNRTQEQRVNGRGGQQQQGHEQQAASICGHAFEGQWLCGVVAERKLIEIRKLTLQRSKLVSDMRKLPMERQLFDPEPIPPSDSRFPTEQIKHLRHGGLTVHAIQQTRVWRRNRTHFDLLHDEERNFFAQYDRPDQKLKLVHFAWHGAPAPNVKGILERGFLSVPSARVGRCYGHGIYLSTESFARCSEKDRYSVPDNDGFKYMLLCEVLPGTVEISKRDQSHPSTHYTHSGVDKIPNASMHIFYTYDMNVRISPKFLVCIHPKVKVGTLSRLQNVK